MPNGRSGGFIIQKADLKDLVKALSGTTIIGDMLGHGPPLRPVSVSDAARFVEECPHDRVAVEEQDLKGYVFYLSNEPKLVWLVVGSLMLIRTYCGIYQFP